MPKIKLRAGILREAKNDWRNTYNNEKLRILNKINRQMNGGAATVEKKGGMNNWIMTILIILTIIIVFIVLVFAHGLYQKNVKKDQRYDGLNPLQFFKKSIKDIVNYFKDTKKEIKEKIIEDKEVYNLGNNSFTYDEANLACTILGGRLATKDEIKGAYNKGAEWCNYGWSADGQALYPTQEKTYNMLKNAGRDGECGVPGVNGGYFENKGMKFGANCYGVKPKANDNNLIEADCSDPKVTQLLNTVTGQYGINYNCIPSTGKSADLRLDQLLKKINPFNNYTWSKDSRKNQLYIGNNSLVRNGMRFETFTNPYDEKKVSKPNFSREVFKIAMKEIITYLKDLDPRLSLKNEALQVMNGDITEVKADKKKIAETAINRIMIILLKYDIPVDNKKLSNALHYFDSNVLNSYKRDIDYILTTTGIDGKYIKYKVALEKKRKEEAEENM